MRFGLMVGMALWIVIICDQTASASCGDYLFQNGKPVSEHPMVNQKADYPAEIDLSASSLPLTPLSNPVRRCSGSNCSKQPSPFSPTPGAPGSELRIHEPAALLKVLQPFVETCRAARLHESERGARYLPSTVFRPPAA